VTLAVPTPEQQAVFEAIASGTGHVAVEAVAGSGKTTTAIGCASLGKGKVGFVAFSKAIAEELKTRLNGTARACTLHSLGLAAVRKACPSIQVDEGKPTRLLQILRPDWYYESRKGKRAKDEARACIALSRLAKYALVDPVRGERQAFAALAERHALEMPDDAGDVLDHVSRLMAFSADETDSLDFDDMIWLPEILDLPTERFDLLLVDESQDLSAAQQALAFRASEGGRMVPVGDRRQSIFGFAGADPDAFPRLIGRLGESPAGCLERPLTVTFRCPVSHVVLAQQIVPQIQAAPGAIDGVIRHVSEEDLRRHLAPGDLVISRRTAPLVTLAFRLLAASVPVLLRGRDVGKGLLDLVEQLRADNPIRLLEELELWRTRELEKLERKDAPDSHLQSVHDRADCLKELAAGSVSLTALRETIGKLFGDDPGSAEGKVVLSSIHRAKGLEADRVAIIDTKSLPLVLTCRHCRGKGCDRCGQTGTRTQPWEFEQELNLAYVAVTRARKELTFAGPLPTCFGGF